MTDTPDSLRRQLADGAATASSIERSDAEIAKAAAARHGVVSARMDELRGKAIAGDQEADDEYQQLVAERGQLDIVMGSGHAAS